MKRIILYVLSIIFVSAPAFGMNNLTKVVKNTGKAIKPMIVPQGSSNAVYSSLKTLAKNEAKKTLNVEKIQEPVTPNFNERKQIEEQEVQPANPIFKQFTSLFNGQEAKDQTNINPLISPLNESIVGKTLKVKRNKTVQQGSASGFDDNEVSEQTQPLTKVLNTFASKIKKSEIVAGKDKKVQVDEEIQENKQVQDEQSKEADQVDQESLQVVDKLSQKGDALSQEASTIEIAEEVKAQPSIEQIPETTFVKQDPVIQPYENQVSKRIPKKYHDWSVRPKVLAHINKAAKQLEVEPAQARKEYNENLFRIVADEMPEVGKEVKHAFVAHVKASKNNNQLMVAKPTGIKTIQNCISKMFKGQVINEIEEQQLFEITEQLQKEYTIHLVDNEIAAKYVSKNYLKAGKKYSLKDGVHALVMNDATIVLVPYNHSLQYKDQSNNILAVIEKSGCDIESNTKVNFIMAPELAEKLSKTNPFNNSHIEAAVTIIDPMLNKPAEQKLLEAPRHEVIENNVPALEPAKPVELIQLPKVKLDAVQNQAPIAEQNIDLNAAEKIAVEQPGFFAEASKYITTFVNKVRQPAEKLPEASVEVDTQLEQIEKVVVLPVPANHIVAKAVTYNELAAVQKVTGQSAQEISVEADTLANVNDMQPKVQSNEQVNTIKTQEAIIIENEPKVAEEVITEIKKENKYPIFTVNKAKLNAMRAAKNAQQVQQQAQQEVQQEVQVEQVAQNEQVVEINQKDAAQENVQQEVKQEEVQPEQNIAQEKLEEQNAENKKDEEQKVVPKEVKENRNEKIEEPRQEEALKEEKAEEKVEEKQENKAEEKNEKVEEKAEKKEENNKEKEKSEKEENKKEKEEQKEDHAAKASKNKKAPRFKKNLKRAAKVAAAGAGAYALYKFLGNQEEVNSQTNDENKVKVETKNENTNQKDTTANKQIQPKRYPFVRIPEMKPLKRVFPLPVSHNNHQDNNNHALNDENRDNNDNDQNVLDNIEQPQQPVGNNVNNKRLLNDPQQDINQNNKYNSQEDNAELKYDNDNDEAQRKELSDQEVYYALKKADANDKDTISDENGNNQKSYGKRYRNNGGRHANGYGYGHGNGFGNGAGSGSGVNGFGNGMETDASNGSSDQESIVSWLWSLLLLLVPAAARAVRKYKGF